MLVAAGGVSRVHVKVGNLVQRERGRVVDAEDPEAAAVVGLKRILTGWQQARVLVVIDRLRWSGVVTKQHRCAGLGRQIAQDCA